MEKNICNKNENTLFQSVLYCLSGRREQINTPVAKDTCPVPVIKILDIPLVEPKGIV